MAQSRRMLVLRAVVEDYIRSQEPVGSTTLTRDHDLGVSSATVRNDMAALEDEGYLIQPHTSAGKGADRKKGTVTSSTVWRRSFQLSEAQRAASQLSVRIGQSAGHAAAGRPAAGADHRTGRRRGRAVTVEVDIAAYRNRCQCPLIRCLP